MQPPRNSIKHNYLPYHSETGHFLELLGEDDEGEAETQLGKPMGQDILYQDGRLEVLPKRRVLPECLHRGSCLAVKGPTEIL